MPFPQSNNCKRSTTEKRLIELKARFHVLAKNQLNAVAAFVERNHLLPRTYTLLLCLIVVLPNIGPVRTLYYVILFPMFLIALRKDEFRAVVRSPVFILVTAYFLIFVITAPFVPGFNLKSLAEHIRNSVLVMSFLGMTAVLVRRDPRFPFELFLFLAVAAAVVGLANVWHFYGGLPPLDQIPRRLMGISGLTMYLNTNWIAQIYGVICVGAIAAATHPRTHRAAAFLLIVSAIILLACVVLTQTRSVLIGVVGGIGIVILLLPNQTALQRAIQLGVVAAAVLASLPFAEALFSRGEPYRLAFWEAYVPLVEARPWTGWGLASPIITKAPDGFETTHPHNIVYHALLRGGFIAMGLLVALLIAVCQQAIRAWTITGSSIYPALAFMALIPLQLEFTVVVGTSVGWDWLVLWMPVGLCMGANILEGATANASSAPTPVRMGR